MWISLVPIGVSDTVAFAGDAPHRACQAAATCASRRGLGSTSVATTRAAVTKPQRESVRMSDTTNAIDRPQQLPRIDRPCLTPFAAELMHELVGAGPLVIERSHATTSMRSAATAPFSSAITSDSKATRVPIALIHPFERLPALVARSRHESSPLRGDRRTFVGDDETMMVLLAPRFVPIVMTYRDDLGALRVRLANLEAEQAQLGARRRELERTSARLAEVAAELADVRGRVEKERRLPLLDGVKIATPCQASWDDMIGDERVRFCGSCQKNVYNVVALTREEAEDVIRAHEGDVCMRLYQKKDGTILTADCPVGVKRKRRRRLVAGALVAAGAGIAAVFGGATATMGEIAETHDCFDFDQDIDQDFEVVAGGIGSVPPQPAPEPTHELGPAPSASTAAE